GAGILGCMVLGALIMIFVSVHTGIIIPMGEGVEPFSLQTGLFDTILPGLLSLAATLMCYALVSKGWSSTKVLLLLVVIGVVGSVTGILA
ncbi:MAG TPA: PTS system mannose/fructose/sorbose family transporter subunit IID, partial [Atopobiaceae bacterium]|nr:PTS system mannose/fructose/sorbose family transporter subunit IID [Atopobiaceae bacterium]